MQSNPERASGSKAPGDAGPAAAWAAMAALFGLAACLAAYLAWASGFSGAVAGCGPEAGCGEVLKTRWGRWFGIPVGGLATVAYAILGGMAWKSRKGATEGMLQGIIAGCGTVLLAAAWFVGLQAIVIGKFCVLCCATHCLAATASLTGLWIVRGAGRNPAVPLAQPLGVAVLLVGALAGGQLAQSNPGPAIAGMAPGIPAAQAATNTAAGAASTRREPPPVSQSPALLSLHQGAFVLRLDELPLRGRPDAAHVMVSTFDYTCPHCRSEHKPILEALRVFSNHLAVVKLPMPLDRQCNRLMKRGTPEMHTNACILARMALAVWRGDRSRFDEFDDWLMEAPRNARPELVRARAESLVGTNRLAELLQDPWIETTLKLSIDLYQTNANTLRKGNLPMLVIGSNIISGSLPGQTTLYDLLESGFGLRLPP